MPYGLIMADIQTTKDIATLTAEVQHLKETLETQEAACRLRDSQALERIKALEAKLGKAERYGWFFMGMVAVGISIGAGFEKVFNKIMMVAP